MAPEGLGECEAAPANAFAVGATLSPGATRFAGLAGLAGLADFAGFAGALVAWLAVFFPEAFLVVALGLRPDDFLLDSAIAYLITSEGSLPRNRATAAGSRS